MNIEQLPNEMLSAMFDYLDGKDILVMFLVSKTCNEIISNNSKLMEKIKLVFDFNKIKGSCFTRSANVAKLMDPHDLFHSNRKYQELEILNTQKLPNESIMQIFKKFQNIKMLTLKDCQFRESVSCIRPILDIFKATLIKIRIENVSCAKKGENLDSDVESLEFECLKALTIFESSVEFLKNFSKSKLIILNITTSVDPELDVVVINFLNMQDNLMSLNLALYGLTTIFSTTDLSSTKFQLEGMGCFRNPAELNQDISNINYQQFLKRQAKSLISLTITGCCSETSCCIFLSEMPKLKVLAIISRTKNQNNTNYNSLPVNDSIELCCIKLNSPNDCIQNIVKSMRKLQHLYLIKGNVKFLFGADLKILKCLHLVSCTVDESMLTEENGAFQSLERLELVDVSWDLARHLIIKNPQLKGLKISSELDHQVRELIRTENLNSLKVVGMR